MNKSVSKRVNKGSISSSKDAGNGNLLTLSPKVCELPPIMRQPSRLNNDSIKTIYLVRVLTRDSRTESCALVCRCSGDGR